MLNMEELKNVVHEQKKQVIAPPAGSTLLLIDTHHLVSDKVKDSSSAVTLLVKQN